MEIDLRDLKGRIIGPYKLLERKGDPSAWGIVYLGENINTGRPAAVKILAGLEKWETERRETEAEVHCSLVHPNIVPVQYFGNVQAYGVFLLATDFVMGASLAKILEVRNSPLSLEETIQVLIAMTGALFHVHSRSTLHLDLKPSNIMIKGKQEDPVLSENVRLIDFGFGVWTTESSAGKHPCFGTTIYSAPEQFKNEKLTEKTDIFQLGLVIFEMLTGQRPFADPVPDNERLRILNDPVPSASAVNASLEKSIDGFLEKILAKEPGDRFSTVEEVFDEFMKCVPAHLKRSRSHIPRGETLPGLNYVRSFDGVELALTQKGSHRPLIFLPPWVSHQGLLWATDAIDQFLSALAGASHLISYDKRGCGLSKPRQIKDCSIDAQVRDLDAVCQLNMEQVALFGISAGGYVAIRYAACFPEKVSKLILYGTYACGRDILTPEQKEAQIALVKGYWGREECAGFFVELFGGTQLIREHIRRYLLASSSREHAAEFLSQIYDVDVTEYARNVKCPTLILHRYSDRAIPYRMAEQLKQLIPRSKLEEVPGSSHLPWIGKWEDESKRIVELILGFLGDDVG